MERKQIRKITLTALFAAMISAGAFIRIPMVPVPITLTTLFTMLGSACLPPSLALSSIIVYIFIGAAGLPVFTSGGGLASLLGPTGGYLIGMIPAAFAGSMLMKAFETKPRAGALLSSLVSVFFTYLIGLPWLKWQMGISSQAAILSGFVPFIIGDTLKVTVTCITAPAIRKRVMEMLSAE